MLQILMLWLVARDTGDQRRRSRKFIELFNRPDVVERTDMSGLLFQAVRACVTVDLSNPESAVFGNPCIREGKDGRIRAAGPISFAGTENRITNAFYMVEFDRYGRPELLAISESDPVLRKELPKPLEWDGSTIPYASPHAAPSRVHQFWLIFLIVLAVLLLIAIIRPLIL